ncbi:MAG: SurA N-terminal domain-containing protein [Moraxellaceae bacterium]
MEAFRTLIKGWVGKVLLVIFLVPFALVGMEGLFSLGSKAGVAATVNKKDVSATELEQALNQRRQQLLQQVGNDESKINSVVLREQVLDGLVERAMLLQQAQALGFQITDVQAAALIRKEPSFEVDGKFSEERFQSFLKMTGQNSKALIQDIQSQMAVQQFAGGLTASAITSKAEIQNIIVLQDEKRTVHLAQLPLEPYLAQVTVSAAEIQSDYDKNKATLKVDENIDLQYVVLSSDQFLAQVSLTEDDLKAQYDIATKDLQSNVERRAQHILISVDDKTNADAALKKSNELIARINKGESFDALATEFSQDPGSAQKGGDLGFAPKGVYVPEFEASLDVLAINQVSAPIKTQFGYHIIKLLEKRSPELPTLDSMRVELTEQAKTAKAAALYNDAINQLNDLAVDASDLTELTKPYQLVVQSQAGLTRKNGAGDLANPDLIKAAFSEEVMLDHQISSGIAVNPTRNIWLKSTQHRTERAQTLAEASGLIKLKLQEQKAIALAMQEANKIVDELNKGANPATVQASRAIQFADFGQINRQNGLPNKKAQTAAFALTKPNAGQWRAAAVAGEQGTGISIVAVSEIQAGQVDSLPEDQRKQMSTMLASMRGQQDLRDYTEYLKSRAKIKILAAPSVAAQ